jgi:hypothetical protein
MGQFHRHHTRIRSIDLIESAALVLQKGHAGEYYRATIGKENRVGEKRKRWALSLIRRGQWVATGSRAKRVPIRGLTA